MFLKQAQDNPDAFEPDSTFLTRLALIFFILYSPIIIWLEVIQPARNNLEALLLLNHEVSNVPFLQSDIMLCVPSRTDRAESNKDIIYYK